MNFQGSSNYTYEYYFYGLFVQSNKSDALSYIADKLQVDQATWDTMRHHKVMTKNK